MGAGTFAGIAVLILAFLSTLAVICVLLWRALQKDSMREDLRTLWNFYPDETKTSVVSSFRKSGR